MTKKKRNHPDIEEVLARPWCYYCERDFDDLKILINHQKAKHFKCERCGRRLNTAGGLSVHMSQVHKENLTAVDNALPNRVGLDIEIFGMEGIPEEIVQQHNQRVLINFHQAQAERQAATGNPATGAAGENAAKKPKLESVSDLKKRLAEHKAAKLAAEQGGSSGGSTPLGAGQSRSQSQAPAVPPTASPSYPLYQQPYAAPPTNGSYSQAPSYSPQTTAAPVHSQPPYGHALPQPQPLFGQQVTQPYAQAQAYAQPPQPSFHQPPPGSYQPQPAFSPPPYQNQPPYPYPPNGAGPYPGLPNAPHRPFGAASPVSSFPHHTTPPNNFPQPVRTGSVSLPSAPGLPQRPAFGAPPVNAFQFQQMHQGQIPAAQSHTAQSQSQKPDISSLPAAPGVIALPSQASPVEAPNAASIDDLISSASKQADANAAAAVATVNQTALSQAATTSLPSLAESAPVVATVNKDEATEDKAAKKEKEKPKATRLVYSDNEISPEEKMAKLPKYAFTPTQKSITT